MFFVITHHIDVLPLATLPHMKHALIVIIRMYG